MSKLLSSQRLMKKYFIPDFGSEIASTFLSSISLLFLPSELTRNCPQILQCQACQSTNKYFDQWIHDTIHPSPVFFFLAFILCLRDEGGCVCVVLYLTPASLLSLFLSFHRNKEAWKCLCNHFCGVTNARSRSHSVKCVYITI